MDKLSAIAAKIIKEQAIIIGPLAWKEAEKVKGIHIINESVGEVELMSGDQKDVINRLVMQYERLFGETSREMCKEAVADMLISLSPGDIPSSLMA